MTEQLADWVKPHLDNIMKEASKQLNQLQIETTTEKLTKKVSAGTPLTEMGPSIQKLAKALIGEGYNTRTKLVNKMHKILQEIDPEITKRDTKDAISGYGKFRSLSKEEVDENLRDIKGQLQQLSKLEDMRKGQAPAKTGVERREPSDEERRLIKLVNEAKKKGGFTVTDPVKQLRSALDAIKRRLTNSIADLEAQIKSRTRIVKTKTPQPSDAETKALTARRDALRAEFDEIFGKRQVTDAQRIKSAVSSLKRSIADYEKRIKAGDIKPKKGKPLPKSKEVDALKARRDALKAEMDLMREMAKPKKNPEAIAEQRYKARLLNDIAKFKESLASGDIAKKDKKATPSTPAIEKLKSERKAAKTALDTARQLLEQQGGISKAEVKEIVDLAQNIHITKQAMEASERRKTNDKATDEEMEYGLAVVALEKYIEALQYKAEKKRIPARLKNWLISPADVFLDIAGTAKALRASMDNSFIGRQGIKMFYLGLTFDFKAGKIWTDTFFKSFKIMLGSFAGKPVMDVLRAEIISDPDYDLMRRAKVATAVAEEEFPVHWPSKIPGIGRFFRASEEAFTGSAYYMRYRAAKMYFDIARNTGVNMNDTFELHSIGRLVNALTARGYTGQSGKSSAANVVFWSPKMVKGNLDTLVILPIFGRSKIKGEHIVSKFAQRQAAKNLIRIIMGQAAVLFIAEALFPDSVEKDPLSSDFGKIKVGNTRFDISGGSAGMITLAMRLAFSKKKTIEGEIIDLNEQRYGTLSKEQLAYNFLENKMAPASKLVWDAVTSMEHFGGEPITVKSALKSLTVPLPFETMQELMEDPESANVILGLILESHGISAQTYGKDDALTGGI